MRRNGASAAKTGIGLAVAAAAVLLPAGGRSEALASPESGLREAGVSKSYVSWSAGSSADSVPAATTTQQAPVTKGAPSGGSLPAGHPDITTMRQPGGAAAGGAMPQLPAGHPEIPGMGKAPVAAAGPTTQVSRGTLHVQAVQGTPGGPAIQGDAIAVEFYHRGQVVGKAEAVLDPKGQATVNGVPIGGGVQPVIRITHGGVEFQTVGDLMDPSRPTLTQEAKVYEATEAAPAWNVKMRHVIVEPIDGGVQVHEMIAIENPGDRAWVGQKQADGSKLVFAWPLPAGAGNVELGGAFHECCTKQEKNAILNTMALVPGTSQYEIAYTLAATKDEVQLVTAAPAPIKQMMVLMPDDGTKVHADGLILMATTEMGQNKVKTRMYRGSDLAAGKPVTLAVSGLKAAVAAAGTPGGTSGAADRAGGAGQIGKVVAAVGGLLVLLLGGAFMFTRGPKAKA